MESKFKFEELSVNIKVCVRFKPLSKSEEELISQNKASKCVKLLENTVQVLDVLNPQTFTFDDIFGPEVNQATLFEQFANPAIFDLFAGFNSTIFAYGATGSGKTYTMMGSLDDSEAKGIIPRIADLLTDPLRTCQMTVSCLEIYRERLQDLIVQSNSSLKLKEADLGVYVEGLSKVSFSSKEELLKVFESAEKLRAVSATKLNRHSSRSHFLLIVEICQVIEGKKTISKLNLIDLAGSEKVRKSEVSGTSMEEAKKINLSLSALGKVICALSTGAKHIPYRDSKLTRLLQDSLGGNSKTNLIVNCSQMSFMIEETLSSLRFAQRAKLIKNTLKLVKEVSLESELKSVKLELNKTQSELKRLKNQSFPEFAFFKENEDEEYFQTLQIQNLNNEKNILKLECENKELKRKIKEKKKNLENSVMGWKLASLKMKNEQFIGEHLEFKCDKLEKFLRMLRVVVSETLTENSEELNLVNIDESMNENVHDLDWKTAENKELNIFYLQAEQFEKNLKKALKILNWKLFYVYGKNKINSQSCINQQTELRQLENLIEKFRKHMKLVRDKSQLYGNEGKILESKLDIVKNQSLLWKTRMQLEINNKKCVEKVQKELSGLCENILTECGRNKGNNYCEDIEKVSDEIAQTTNLLISWIQACKEKQKKLGMDTSDIEELLVGIQTLGE